MNASKLRTWVALNDEGEVVYYLLAYDEHDARRRVLECLGDKQPAVVAEWEAAGRPVTRLDEYKAR